MIGRAAWIAAGCLVARVASADSLAYRVQWTRAPGAEACIETPALVAGVEARLGRPLGVAGTDARVVDGSVERTATGFHARILVNDERGVRLGERELDEPSADCRVLDPKLTLVIALAIDPDAVARQAAAPAVVVKPPPTAAITVARTIAMPASRTPWHVELGVFGIGALGVMPGAGAAGGVTVAVDAPRVPPIVASLSAWLPDRTTVDAGGSRFTRIGGGLEICPSLLARGRVELAA